MDIQKARVALTSKEPSPVDNGLLRQVRIGQYSEDVVRVVLDMTSLGTHNATVSTESSPSGHRSLWAKGIGTDGRKAPAVSADFAKSKSPAQSAKAVPPGPAVRGLRKSSSIPATADPGAIGNGGIAEKDLALSIAKKLAAKLKKEMNVQVVLTRNDDRFVALEDRTALANAENADLFISLHMNASPNSDARGIETYYLDNTSDEAAIRLAARKTARRAKTSRTCSLS